MTPVVSIIVVSYNTKDMTLEALRTAREQTSVPCEFIVVDNASEDGSAQAIAEQFPEMTLLAETENHGFAKANNIAAALAKGEYLLLLNPDTVTLDGAIDKLVAFAQRTPEARLWGGKTLYGDRSLNPTNCWDNMTVWSLFCAATGLSRVFSSSEFFNPEAYGNWDRDSERGVGFVTGCFLLIKRAFWNELGGFDLRFVMYGEEVDLAHRARARGARPRVTPDAVIVHYVGAATTVKVRKAVFVLKARSTLIQLYFGPMRRRVGLVLLQARVVTRAAFSQTWREVWSRRAEWVHGYPPL